MFADYQFDVASPEQSLKDGVTHTPKSNGGPSTPHTATRATTVPGSHRSALADTTDLNIAVLFSEATDQQILPSRGEVRKLVKANGLSVNGTKLTSPDTLVSELLLLHDKYLVVKKGKSYYLVELT
ncbi:MAG: hypothetical protein EOO60_10280 [Hymenobacter sp.]|nr:MAG: hypothetical protein EOO60_10280 [Hymenobacter sp.]